MDRYIIDTSVVADLVRGRFSLTEVFPEEPPLVFCTPVIAELLYGALRSQRPEYHTERVRELIAAHEAHYADWRTIEFYAQLKAQLVQQGNTIPDNDIWVSAHAQALGIPVLTRDRHFERVRSLVQPDIIFL